MDTELARPAESAADEVRRLLTLAWPIVVANLGMQLLGVVDTAMVRPFGSGVLAAIAIGDTWSVALYLFGFGVAIGLDPVISQAWGARDEARAGRTLVHGLALLTALSVPITALHGLAGPGLAWLGQPPESLELAADYAVVVGWSTWPLLMTVVLRQALQARGLVRPAMWVMAVGNVVNVGANQLLMFGVGAWPGLGPIGAAWSTVIVRVVSLGVLCLWARRELEAVRRHASAATELGEIRRLAGIAIPIGLQVALEVWAFTAATVMAGWFGSVALAAHAVALKLASMAFMTPMALSSAAATRVGNLLGAGAAWARAGWTAVGAGVAVMALSASLFMALPGVLVGLFLDVQDPAFALAASLLPIAAAFQLFDGAQVVLFGVLRGAGDARLPALANVVGYWLLGLPLGVFLSTRMALGVHGVWYALALSLAVVSSLLAARLRHVAARGGFRL